MADTRAVYLVGGASQHFQLSPGRHYTVHPDCYKLEVARRPLAWRWCGRLSEARSHMAVGRVSRYLVAAGGNVYDHHVGGYARSTLRATTDVLDLRRERRGWRRRSPIPFGPRAWAAFAATRTNLLVIGGLDKQHIRRPGEPEPLWFPLRDMLSYDPARDRWRRERRIPLSLSIPNAVLYRNRYVLVVGGVQRSYDGQILEFSRRVFAYDLRTRRWGRLRQDRPLTPHFNDPALGLVDDRLYVAGNEGAGGSHWNELWIGRIAVRPPAARTAGTRRHRGCLRRGSGKPHYSGAAR